MEYWIFTLFNTIIMLALFTLFLVFTNKQEGITKISSVFLIILIIYFFAVLTPALALTVRRLHDSNRSGAWIFLYFCPYTGGFGVLILMCLNGTLGPNLYGEDPLNNQIK